jgi:hypothetical protein
MLLVMKVSAAFCIGPLRLSALDRDKSIGCLDARPYTKTRFTGIFRRLADEDAFSAMGDRSDLPSSGGVRSGSNRASGALLQQKMQANLAFV